MLFTLIGEEFMWRGIVESKFIFKLEGSREFYIRVRFGRFVWDGGFVFN